MHLSGQNLESAKKSRMPFSFDLLVTATLLCEVPFRSPEVKTVWDILVYHLAARVLIERINHSFEGGIYFTQQEEAK